MNLVLNYRDWLKHHFVRRKASNVQYSLRAFARDLNIQPSLLSEVMRNKKGLSADTALRVAAVLNLSPAEQFFFCDLVQSEHARSQPVRAAAKNRIQQAVQVNDRQALDLEQFEVISSWYYYAILELSTLADFESTSIFIAKRLGLSRTEIDHALERLLRLGLIKKTLTGKLLRVHAHLSSPTDVPSQSLKDHQRQLLAKALQALEVQDLGDRDFTSMIMAIDPKKIPEAKLRIKKFRRELAAFLEDGPTAQKTEVYALSQQLFRLTEKLK